MIVNENDPLPTREQVEAWWRVFSGEEITEEDLDLATKGQRHQ